MEIPDEPQVKDGTIPNGASSIDVRNPGAAGMPGANPGLADPGQREPGGRSDDRNLTGVTPIRLVKSGRKYCA